MVYWNQKVNLIILIGGASEVINKPAIDMCEYIKILVRQEEKKRRKEADWNWCKKSGSFW